MVWLRKLTQFLSSNTPEMVGLYRLAVAYITVMFHSNTVSLLSSLFFGCNVREVSYIHRFVRDLKSCTVLQKIISISVQCPYRVFTIFRTLTIEVRFSTSHYIHLIGSTLLVSTPLYFTYWGSSLFKLHYHMARSFGLLGGYGKGGRRPWMKHKWEMLCDNEVSIGS